MFTLAQVHTITARSIARINGLSLLEGTLFVLRRRTKFVAVGSIITSTGRTKIMQLLNLSPRQHF